MNMTMIMIGFALAVMMGAALIVLLLLLLTRPAGDSGMHDLAICAVATIGGLFALTAFAGSLAGAWLSQLRGIR